MSSADIAGAVACVAALAIIFLLGITGDTTDSLDPRLTAVAPSWRGCLIIHVLALIALVICAVIVFST